MCATIDDFDDQVVRWWRWFAVALFLLIPLDLFTTLLAVARYGTGVEANPVMRVVLQQGLVVTTVVNLLVLGVAIALFHAAVDSVRRVPLAQRGHFVTLINGWIGLLILSGSALVLNNVTAIA